MPLVPADPKNLPWQTDITIGDLKFELNVTATRDSSGSNIGLQNCYAFRCTNEQAAETGLEQLTRFIESAFERYGERLGNNDQMWFYAWYDEQAGQLRLSAHPAARAQDLPFGCSLKVVEEPAIIASLFLASTTKEGIAWSELELVTADDAEPEDPPPYTLTLFARLLRPPS